MSFTLKTSRYLVEFESGMLSISRPDGLALSMTGAGIVRDFRSCVKTHGVEQAIRTYIKIGERVTDWRPMYKPEAIRRILGRAE